ncbi:winged helix-turn-helix transcriptional regulator [Mucilaginibacter lacusdianchii]|uniref:winged helix-turn-helix transcriptional regulator n=1 Tax=Mucilaginibacter lacusdianchii TaxID=2684211 RepID=UPI001E5DC8D5|nr:helix-turn-helix domain-containing protein [Mucilaginibacter sp. JXJ CY 39]
MQTAIRLSQLLSAKVSGLTIKKTVLTQRKALTFRKVRSFAYMTMMIEDLITAPDKATCASSLNNVLDALYVLGGKWKLPLILSLVQSSKRFNEIQHEVIGISPKILAKELKDLELNEFVKRIVYPTTPVTIIYEATEHSLTLKNVLHELSSWGEQHREKIKQSMKSQPVKL